MCAHWQSEYDASPCSYCAADQENAELMLRQRLRLEKQLGDAREAVSHLEAKIEHMTSLAHSAPEIRMELIKLTNQNFDEFRAALAASTKLLHDYDYPAALTQGQLNRTLLEKFPAR